MALSYVWVGMILLSLIFGCINHTLPEVSAAAMSGAQSAVELCVSMMGPLCLWTGVMNVLREGGGLDALIKAMHPVLAKLYPEFRNNEKVMGAISANVAANLLGLGNAATPFGIKAAKAMAEGANGIATDSLCMLVVCNTASIQLIPTTIAAVRSASGCSSPFDILPAVWLASCCSVLTGIIAVKCFGAYWRQK